MPDRTELQLPKGLYDLAPDEVANCEPDDVTSYAVDADREERRKHQGVEQDQVRQRHEDSPTRGQ